MSLLLDALHRASKDKEKAAAAASLPLPLPASDPGELRLTEVGGGDVSFPQLTPEPALLPSRELVQELLLEPAPALQLEAFEPLSALEPVPTPAALPQAQSDRAPAPKMVSAPPPVESPIAPTALLPSGALDSSAKPAPPLASPDRVAKEIRRAYAPDTAPPGKAKRRVFVLGGVALVLFAGFASVFLGVWGDPVALLSLGGTSSLAPVVTSPGPGAAVTASEAPAPVASATQPSITVSPVARLGEAGPLPKATANRQSSVTPVETIVTPSTTQSAASPSRSVPAAVSSAPELAPAHIPPGNEVVLRGTTPKPGFVPKMMGPNMLELGYVALQEGRLDDAARFYRQALAVSADERDALLGLAYIAHQKGQREEAQGYYRRVLRQEPGNTVANAALLELDSAVDVAVSSSRARELVARQPGSAATMAMAGNAMVRDGRLADAVQLFARAQVLEPDNPLHVYNHAVALDRLGQYGLAQVQYENVLKLSDKVAAISRPAFSLEAVRQRLEQLRQALGSRTDADK